MQGFVRIVDILTVVQTVTLPLHIIRVRTAGWYATSVTMLHILRLRVQIVLAHILMPLVLVSRRYRRVFLFFLGRTFLLGE